MRFKEIKPGMAVNCKNDTELTELLKEAERLGYVWYTTNRKPTNRPADCGRTIHFYNSGGIKKIAWSDRKEGVSEFSDLILPELTAEEVLEICGELCKEYSNKGCNCSSKCPFAHHDMSCTFYRPQNPNKAIEILEQWKSDHERKEPEI